MLLHSTTETSLAICLHATGGAIGLVLLRGMRDFGRVAKREASEGELE